MRWLTLILLVGCDVVFPLNTRDASSSLPPCAGSGLDDDFSTGSPCEPWGSIQNDHADVRLDSGHLLVTPEPSAPGTTFGGCTGGAELPIGPEGQILEITGGLTGGATYLVMHAFGMEAGSVDATIDQEMGMIGVYDGLTPTSGAIPYDPPAMRWWRVRPESDGTGMIAEYSADAVVWQFLGAAPGLAPKHIIVNFGAGTNSQEPQPGTASFGRLQVCAP